MKDIYKTYNTNNKGLFKQMFSGIQWRFARMIFGSFLINIFRENLAPLMFGSEEIK